MAFPTTFGSLTGSIALGLLDTQFAAVGSLTPVPCGVSGTNDLTLTPQSNTPTVASFQNYMIFTGVFAQTNSGPMTAALGTLTGRRIYKDGPSGPVTLSGGEARISNSFLLITDSALNSGTGGFHLRTGAAPEIIGQSITPAALAIGVNASLSQSLTFMRSGLFTAAFSISASLSSQDVNAVVTGSAIGDEVTVSPYSTAPTAGLGYSGFIAAAGTVTIRSLNVTGATVAAAGSIFRVSVRRYV